MANQKIDSNGEVRIETTTEPKKKYFKSVNVKNFDPRFIKAVGGRDVFDEAGAVRDGVKVIGKILRPCKNSIVTGRNDDFTVVGNLNDAPLALQTQVIKKFNKMAMAKEKSKVANTVYIVHMNDKAKEDRQARIDAAMGLKGKSKDGE